MLSCRETVQDAGLNLVDQFAGLAGSWDEVVPAPRGLGGFGKAENVVSERVAMVVIEKKPAIE